jgi:hypothetical protein
MADKFLSALEDEKRREAEAAAKGYRLVLPQELGIWHAHNSPERYKRSMYKPATLEQWERYYEAHLAAHPLPKPERKTESKNLPSEGAHELHVTSVDRQHPEVRLEAAPPIIKISR